MSQSSSHINNVYYDEEECLGLGIFVAELELLVGSSRDRKPDQVQLLELLQKIQASLATAETGAIKQHQKRCEAILIDVLYKGTCSSVRVLINNCLVRLYTQGDLLPLYSRVSSLQAFLQDKNAAAEPLRAAVMDLLAALYGPLGRCLASSALESAAIASRAYGRASSQQVKLSALRLAAAVVLGLAPTDRSAGQVQAEAWQLASKAAKDKTGEEVRVAAAGIVAALAVAGGPLLWGNAGSSWEEALRLALAGLEDASQSCREAWAVALAELAAAARPSNPLVTSALDAEKRPAKRQQLEGVLAGALKAALLVPFVEATAAGPSRKPVCTALAVAGWPAYATALQRGGAEPEALVSFAVAAVANMEPCSKAVAEAAAKAAPSYKEAPPVGACLTGGELPHAQACVLHLLRAVLVPALPEHAQRALLAQLTTAAACAVAPPLVVCALEGMGVLLEVLGEVVEEEGLVEQMRGLVMSKLAMSSSAVRHQAAAVLAAMGLAHPPLLASLMDECLEGVERSGQQLSLLATPYANKPTTTTGAPRAGPCTGTPRAAPDSQTKHCIDMLHGHALGMCALLVAAARTPLGVPSRLPLSAYWIAKRLVLQPYCTASWAAAAEREAGYLLLAAICAAGDPALLLDKQDELMELFLVAFGPSAQDAVTDINYVGAAGDRDMAVACWWRAAAAQALSGYVLGVMGKGLAAQPAQQVKLIADMLLPLLETLAAQPHLVDPGARPGDAPAITITSSGGSMNAAALAALAADASANGRSVSNAGATAGGGGATFVVSAGSKSSSPAPTGPVAPVVSAAVATLQLRLLEVFFFLPGAPLWPSCHSVLLQLCSRQLLDVGGCHVSPDAAAAVCSCSLRHMLNLQDAMLGPWLPGRHVLEDELRNFVGEPGGPQQYSWELGLAYTAGYVGHSRALLPPANEASEDTLLLLQADSAAAATTDGSSSTSSSHQAPDAGSVVAAAGVVVAEAGGPASDRVRIARRFLPFPQPLGLGAALLEVQLWLLGKLLAVAAPEGQLQLLELLQGSVSLQRAGVSAAALRRDPGLQRQRAANCVAVAVVGLAGMVPVAKRVRSGAPPCDKVAESLLALCSSLLEENSSDVALCRAVAELMAAATCIAGDTMAIKQVRAMCQQLSALLPDTQPANSDLRSLLCLGLGAIYRSKGAMALQGVLPAAAEQLMAMASRGGGGGHLWALHGLWLLGVAAGPAYSPQVKATLRLAEELLVSSSGEQPLLQPALARLANALVAVLGPEFTLGSSAYQRCKTLVTPLSPNFGSSSPPGASAGSPALLPPAAAAAPGDFGGVLLEVVSSSWSQLERVLFAQQMVVFAPGALPPRKHLLLLVTTLLGSRRPSLRRAAAATLRHLAETHPQEVLQEHIEPALLLALDQEADAATAAALKAAVAVLMAAGVGCTPGYWLQLLGAVTLAAAPAAVKGKRGVEVPSIQADGADEEGGPAAPPPAAAKQPSTTTSTGPSAAPATAPTAGPGSSAATCAAVAAAARTQLLGSTLRLRTRLLAVELLLGMFKTLGGDPRHRLPTPKTSLSRNASYSKSSALNAAADAAAAAAGGGAGHPGVTGLPSPGDSLTDHLQDIVDLGFKLTTASMEALRPAGARLLQRVVLFWGSVADPEVPEMLLLEQYQAQFVAALRAALSPAAAPALAVAGGTLATAFLGAGLAAGDGAVMKRLMDLLSAPLSKWEQLLYGSYMEAVGVRARVALLQAHAQCCLIGAAGGSSRRGAGGSRRGSLSGASSAQQVVAAGSSGPQPEGIVGLGDVGVGARMMVSNQLCSSIVGGAQGVYSELLLVLWWALLQDAVVLLTQVPEVQLRYRSCLFGDASAAVVEAVEPCYAAAWPVVLGGITVKFCALQGGECPPGGAISPSGAAARTAAAAAAPATSGADWEDFVQQAVKGAVGPAGTPSSNSGSSSRSGSTAAGQCSEGLRQRLQPLRTFLVDFALWGLNDSTSAFAAAVAGGEGGTAAAAGGGTGSRAATPSADAPVAATATAAAAAEAAHRLCLCLQALQALLAPDASAVSSTVKLPVNPDLLVQVLQQVAALAGEVLLPVQASKAVAAVAASSGYAASDPAAAAWVYLGVVTAAASRLVHLVVAAAEADGAQSAEAAAGMQQLRATALDCLLLLSSMAVPYALVQQDSSSSSSSSSSSRASEVAVAPPLYIPAPGSSSSSSTAAAVQDCLAAAEKLLQAYSQAGNTQALQLLTQLSVRLLLTVPCGSVQQAAAAPQLEGAVKLLGSCLAAASPVSAASSSTPAALAACHQLHDAIHWQLSLASSSSSSSDSSEAASRLPSLYAALFTAAAAAALPPAAANSSSSSSATATAVAAVDLINIAVSAALQPAAPLSCAAAACEALRVLLQQAVPAGAATPQQLGSRKHFAQQCCWQLGQQVAALVLRLCGNEGSSSQQQPHPLSGAALAAVTAGLKMLLVLLVAPQGEASQVAAMQVLVPCLMAAAAPPAPLPVTPALRDMAAKVLQALPSSACSTGFKAVLAALPAADKMRLQGALKEAAAAGGGAGAGKGSGAAVAAGAAAKKPAIELKMNFALPNAGGGK